MERRRGREAAIRGLTHADFAMEEFGIERVGNARQP